MGIKVQFIQKISYLYDCSMIKRSNFTTATVHVNYTSFDKTLFM